MAITSSRCIGVLAAVLIGSALFALPVYGQEAAPKPVSTGAAPDVNKDDILILVNLAAKELKFDVVPNTKVEFPGTQKRATVWVTDRFNLPDKVEPGVTYRNIGINLRISSRFEDIERIVREALGEVPITTSQNLTPPADTKVSPANPQSAPAKKP